MTSTPALKFLAAHGIAITLHPYVFSHDADAIGIAAAEALGLDPARVLKTLLVEVDGRPACCVLPSDRHLAMKRVAAAFGGKAAAMMPPPRAERLTGYHVGGISPFGQKRRVPTAFEETAIAADRIWVNAGVRGLLLGIGPQEAIAVLGALTRPLIA